MLLLHFGVKHLYSLGLFLIKWTSGELFFYSQLASGCSSTIFKTTLLWYLLSIIWKIPYCCLRLKENGNGRKLNVMWRNTCTYAQPTESLHDPQTVSSQFDLTIILKDAMITAWYQSVKCLQCWQKIIMFYLPAYSLLLGENLGDCWESCGKVRGGGKLIKILNR